MAQNKPKTPAGLRSSGRALWTAVTSAYVLDEHELLVLREACRVADRLDGLDVLLKRDGLLAASSQGDRPHPALTEARQQAVTLAKLLASLRIPVEVGDGRARPRGGPRGVYQIGRPA